MIFRALTLALAALLTIQCNGDDDAGTVTAIKPKGRPTWETGYPNIAHGAVSVDLNVRCDRNVKIHYLVATKDLSLSPEQVIKNAQAPTTIDIKFSGTFDALSGEETRKTINGLYENTHYFTYLVAQNNTDTLFQQSVSKSDFTTYYRQAEGEYQSAVENRKVKYLIYRPEEILKYPDQTYPMCYFLAGNGEVATAEKPINLARNGSLPEYINKGNNINMMVLSIQHTVKDWNVELINEGIEHGNATYPVNLKKVYLTGMSGGAFGCWNYAVKYPAKITAIVPISGGGQTSKACMLNDIAVYGFHNQVDNSVASSNTINMISSIKKCPPNKEVSQLLFPDTGHDCWRRVYDKNHKDWSKSPNTPRVDIYEWLLSKSK
jgi:hypothetical protein